MPQGKLKQARSHWQFNRLAFLGSSAKRSCSTKLKHAMFFHTYFAKAALQSREQLAALMCPHLCRQGWCLGEKESWKRWRGSASRGELTMSSTAASWATCTPSLLIRTERAFIDLLYTACLTLLGNSPLLRMPLKALMPGHFDIDPHVWEYNMCSLLFYFFFKKSASWQTV